MIWLTWRQARASALSVLAVLGALAMALAITGPQLADLFSSAPAEFFERLGLDRPKRTIFNLGTALVYAVPAVVGVFWGAPLVARELEAGTHRLVWAQGVTRTRWLATKMGILAVAALAAGLLGGLALTRWCGPIDDAIAAGWGSDDSLMGVPRLAPPLFGARGVVPGAMAVLALVVGVTASLVLRRTVVAMAATLVAVVGAQVMLPVLVQPHLLAPETALAPYSAETLDGLALRGEPGSESQGIQQIRLELDSPGGWLISQRPVDEAGAPIESFPAWTAEACRPPDGIETCLDRLTAAGYRQEMSYLPAADFWRLQLLESGLLVLAAAGLTALCLWRVRRDM